MKVGFVWSERRMVWREDGEGSEKESSEGVAVWIAYSPLSREHREN